MPTRDADPGRRVSLAGLRETCLRGVISSSSAVALGVPEFADCVTFSSDGLTLAAGREDDLVAAWDVATGEPRF